MKSQIEWQLRQRTILALLGILGLLLVAQHLFAQESQAAGQYKPVQNSALQQTISVLPLADTYIAQGAPDQRRPDLRVMWVGYNQGQGLLNQRSLLRFSLTDIPANAQITNAQLSLHLSATTNGDSPLTINVRQIIGEWAENINWQEMEAAIATNVTQLGDDEASAAVGTAFTQYSWNVTALAQAWQSGGRSDSPSSNTNNISFHLQSEPVTAERERAFWSSNCVESDCGVAPGQRPLLTITYEEPTPEPTASPTPIPLPTATPESDIGIAVSYQLENGSPTEQFPADWQEGEVLDVTLNLSRVNSDTTVTGVNVTSVLPAGTEYVSAAQNGEFDDAKETIEWSDLSIPGSGSQSVSYRIQKPVMISGATIDVDMTAASSVIIFDALVDTGSNIHVIWDFGDGSPAIKRPTSFIQTLQFQHTFQAAGEYEVTLYVYNKACKLSITETVTVSEESLGEQAATSSNQAIAAHASVAALSAPNTDGTAQLPLCPESITHDEPLVVARWQENGVDRVSYVNAEQLYLPTHVVVPRIQ